MTLYAEPAPGLFRIPAVALRPDAAQTRHVLSILDLSLEEQLYLARRAVRIKHAPAAPQTLRGRTVGVYFRKRSAPRRWRWRAAHRGGATRRRRPPKRLSFRFSHL